MPTKTKTNTNIRRCLPLVLFLGLVLSLSAACASVGTGDAVVVRAEDLLTNSLTTYSLAMDYHFKNSTTETPQVYKAFESFREKFPVAWNALDSAKRAYKANKTMGTARLDAALSALSDLIAAVTPLIPVPKPKAELHPVPWLWTDYPTEVLAW